MKKLQEKLNSMGAAMNSFQQSNTNLIKKSQVYNTWLFSMERRENQGLDVELNRESDSYFNGK